MKAFIFLLIVSFAACQPSSQPAPKQGVDISVTDTVAVIHDVKINSNTETNAFTEIDTSGILMFPLGHNESDYEGSFSSGERQGHSWNIIFYNSKTGTSHLLSENLKMLIWNYTVENDTYNSGNSNSEISTTTTTDITSTEGLIFYRITLNDFNNDKKLSGSDPTYLFISDKEGNNLRQISPASCNLLSYQYIKASGKVLMHVMKDSNKDKLFDDKDERAWYDIQLENKNDVPQEIFKQEFKNKLKLLFHKQWMQQ